MKTSSPVKPHGKGCVATIEVSPGAAKTEITGVNEWRGAFQVRVAAEARDGAANEELVRFLADRLGISKNDVIIMKGERSSKKQVYLPLAAEKALAVLGGS
jgi:hypothetical protein